MRHYIGITKQLNIVSTPHANLDVKYGPYETIEDALLEIPIGFRAIGLTIGIINNDIITEYWWGKGIQDNDLILKTNGSILTLTFEEYTSLEYKNPNTLYACVNEDNQIDKAFIGELEFIVGGGSAMVRYITISINNTDIDKISDITAVGDVLNKEISLDKSIYRFTIKHSGIVTFNIIPVSGYQVSNLNIDQQGQGAISEYTFNNVTIDHTGYIWMEAVPIIVTPPIYVRSDVPNQEYNSLQLVFNAIKADYPFGLDGDLTITCTTSGIDIRNNEYVGASAENAVLSHFNIGTPYILTIDGANKAIIDGLGFGGLYFDTCANIRIRNFTFQNCNTYEGFYAPEEPACICCTNIDAEGVKNIYIENIIINGLSTKSLPSANYRTRYGITIKKWDNVYIHNCTLNDIACIPIQLDVSKIVTISKTYIKGNMLSGVIGHPYIIQSTGINEIYIQDCELLPNNYNEYAIKVNGAETFVLTRSKITNGKCGVVSVSDYVKNKKLEISYNYMAGNMQLPLYQWDSQWIQLSSDYEEIAITNNLVEFTSKYYQEFFVRSVDKIHPKIINVNNIYRKLGGTITSVINISGVTNYISGNNLYQIDTTRILNLPNLPYQTVTSLTALQGLGYEIGSKNVAMGTAILTSESGGSRRSLIAEYAMNNKAIPEYVQEFDGIYRKNNDINNTAIGFDNTYSSSFDETTDTTEGYYGIDVVKNIEYSDSALFEVPSGNILKIAHKTKNRNKFIRFFITKSNDNSYKDLIMGQKGVFTIQAKVDTNGEYLEDQLYNIEII